MYCILIISTHLHIIPTPSCSFYPISMSSFSVVLVTQGPMSVAHIDMVVHGCGEFTGQPTISHGPKGE